MPDHDRLSSLILEHWTRYQPTMFQQFQQQNRLQQELEATAERFAELIYELVSVRKMEHHQAWEMAIAEFLLPEESSSPNPSNPPAISESPPPTLSDWAARMRRPKRTSKPSGS